MNKLPSNTWILKKRNLVLFRYVCKSYTETHVVQPCQTEINPFFSVVQYAMHQPMEVSGCAGLDGPEVYLVVPLFSYMLFLKVKSFETI